MKGLCGDEIQGQRLLPAFKEQFVFINKLDNICKVIYNELFMFINLFCVFLSASDYCSFRQLWLCQKPNDLHMKVLNPTLLSYSVYFLVRFLS